MTQKTRQTSEKLTDITDFAAAWDVNEKTVSNWVEFTYQAFDIALSPTGPFPEWGVQLLSLCAKHVSQQASFYLAETGQKRRLKGSEYVKLIRSRRMEGHFAEFDQFRNSQNSENSQDAAADLEDDLTAELGALTREADEQLQKIKTAIEQQEDNQIEEVASFIEDAPRRKMNKLLSRLQASKALKAVQDESSMAEAVDVTYTRVS